MSEIDCNELYINEVESYTECLKVWIQETLQVLIVTYRKSKGYV